ncbi:MAG: DegT/DnrJ/EryC1/StrS aminotransferase family protein [Azonexaceae bacterium]|nr:DegT/DnrJ/EryC1/StrS aminotransferase family protein [Azonexaceae bacterium]
MSYFHPPYASWGWPEYQAALIACVQFRVHSGPDISELERQLSQLLGGSQVFAVNSGRTALRIGLEVMGKLRPQCKEVIVPSYICPAVVNAVKSAGLKPVPAEIGTDLNLQLNSARQLIGSNTLGIIVAHMYGCPADIVEFEKLTREAGIFLVDDAAQAVGEFANGQMLGTFGDFGILSFAQSKCMVTGESGAGGALVCQNQEMLMTLINQLQALKPAQSRGRAFAAFVWNYLFTSHTRLATYYWQRICRPSHREIKQEGIANLDAKIALCQLKSLKRRREERIRILDSYAKYLQSVGYAICMPQYELGRYLARAMVLLPHGVDLDRCRRDLQLKSIETRGGYPVFSDENFVSSSAKEVAGRLLELPASSTMSNMDVALVCDRLMEVLQGNNAFMAPRL